MNPAEEEPVTSPEDSFPTVPIPFIRTKKRAVEWEMMSRVSNLYPETTYFKLADILKIQHDDLQDETYIELRESTYIILFDLYCNLRRQKLERTPIFREIKKFHKAMLAALQSANALSAQSRSYLLGRGTTELLDNRSLLGSRGRQKAWTAEVSLHKRFKQFQSTLDSLARWSSALDLDDQLPAGRVSFAHVEEAIGSLKKVWSKRRGEPKLSYKNGETYGPFLSFCQQALTPLLSEFGLKSDLQRSVRNCLYGSNVDRKPTPKPSQF